MTPKKRILLIPFDEIIPTAENASDLIEGILPAKGLILLYGKPKSGKSFLALDMMLRVALGESYRGRKVQKGPVVYCALEGDRGVALRIHAFRQANKDLLEGKGVPFFLQPNTIDLVKDGSHLIQAIKNSLGDKRPVAVVLDTLNRSFVGSEANDADMAAYIKAADAVREELGCSVIIVHHTGHDHSRPRGHTSLVGAVDAQLRVERKPHGEILLKVELCRDGPEGAEIWSRLREVPLAGDGAPTSCVVEPMDKTGTVGDGHLSHGEHVLLNCLKDLAAEVGDVKPDLLRSRSYDAGISKSAQPRARQQAYFRAMDKLAAKGLLVVNGDVVALS